MTEIAYYHGSQLDLKESLDSQLFSLGLTKEKIDNIYMQAYRDQCCETMEDLVCASPIIDYGTPEVKGYSMFLPHLNDQNKVVYVRSDIFYCPFCGKYLPRAIHPANQSHIEDYHE